MSNTFNNRVRNNPLGPVPRTRPPPPPGFLFRNNNQQNRRTRRRNIFRSYDLSFNRINLTNNFTNQIMNIINNSLYDIQPRRNIQPEEYENLIESDNWTNLSTRYNLPIDTVCPITQNSLGEDTHQETIRICSCGHVFSRH